MPVASYDPPLSTRLPVLIVFRWSPTFFGCFDPDILQLVGQQWWPVHYSMDPGFQHRSSRRCHNQHDALSAASINRLAAAFLALPHIPRRRNNFQTDCAGNPLHPTSTGNNQTFHPLSRHSETYTTIIKIISLKVIIFVVNLRPFSPELVMFSDFEFQTPSVLLFCFTIPTCLTILMRFIFSFRILTALLV